jgi:apolipoprotein D and lipocalin family protein
MKTCRLKPILLLALLLAGCGGGGGGTPLTLAKSVDLSRYSGKWYIVAEIPYWGERGNVGDTATYTVLPNGTIDDKYFAHEGSFTGKVDTNDLNDYVVAGTNNALWRVRLFWPIYVSYPILYVDPEYRIALVGYPDRSLGWIFSRSKTMDDATYQAMLKRFAAEGYDISQFRRVPQSPDEIGKPGFG